MKINSFYATTITFHTSRKFCIFPKGLTHDFGHTFDIFSSFFVGNIGQENVFYDILEQQNVFLAYQKTRSSKRQKNLDFSKGVNTWFWSKNGHFSIVFFFFTH